MNSFTSKASKLRALCASLLIWTMAVSAEPRASLDIHVPMRDGVKLLTDVYLPEGDGPFPVVLCRLPYGTQTDYAFQPKVGEFFASHGFAYVTQNVRGRYGSEGVFTAYVEGQEIPDAYDTLDWIVAQDWSNDQVGVMGESYYGYTALMAAVSGHPAIKAISPANITLAREKQTLDGAFPLQASGLWTLDLDDIEQGKYQNTAQIDLTQLPLITLGERYGLRDVLWRERITGYSADPFGPARSALEHYPQVRVPALHFGGWYDSFTRGTIIVWNSIQQLSSNQQARAQQWLVMGPWDHDSMSIHLNGEPLELKVGQRDLGDAAVAAYSELLLSFFDHFLKGVDNGFDQRPRVRYFNIGDNAWHDSASWPPQDVHTESLYLHAGRVLNATVPADEAPEKFTYDPNNPVTITAHTNVWGRAAGLPDRQELLARNDVLSFDTEPLTEDYEITGPIALELYIASSAPDTDFTAALVDVYPDGYSLLIQEGIKRASFRNPAELPSNIVPGEVYRLDIDLWATSYTIPAGHRIRLEVSSSNFPRFARNLNNGEAFGMSDRVEVAQQTVHHSQKHPSRLLLPKAGDK
ncbi:MAG: CocE/NonD family hydrolase [Xanthomonadales bacterium]|nr:CocE/NonD family hydrolase [Xanthomonadales bacterium]